MVEVPAVAALLVLIRGQIGRTAPSVQAAIEGYIICPIQVDQRCSKVTRDGYPWVGRVNNYRGIAGATRTAGVEHGGGDFSGVAIDFNYQSTCICARINASKASFRVQ